MEYISEAAPVLKWAGGKRQLIGALSPLLPEEITSYCEPFIGGGAMLFHLQPAKALVNDINADLIRVYEVIRDDVGGLIKELKKYRNEAGFFYAVRGLDRDRQEYEKLTDVEKAARVLYLNRTCYNGLYRVNAAGQFNAPYGRYKNPDIVNERALRAAHDYFNEADIRFSSGDFADALSCLGSRAFAYLDPPYDPVSETASFTGYAKGGFPRSEQERLRECCDGLDRKGVKFMLSNSATPFIMDLYRGYDITIVRARRSISSAGSRRGSVDEVVVRNYA